MEVFIRKEGGQGSKRKKGYLGQDSSVCVSVCVCMGGLWGGLGGKKDKGFIIQIALSLP